MKFLESFKLTTTVYVFEKNGEKSYFITEMIVKDLIEMLKADYDKNSWSHQFENYINKQFYNGFTIYAKRYEQLNMREKMQVEVNYKEIEKIYI